MESQLLYICEKPSQASDLAGVLGINRKGKGYITNDSGTVITWAVGHLLELLKPDEYSPDLKTWSLDTLPIIPTAWKFKVKPKTHDQFDIVSRCIKATKCVVVATDFDREGEAIARSLLDYCNYKGPVKRLCLRALDPASIKKALADIKEGHETLPLYQEAMARQQADWLVGMNFSRLWSIMARMANYKETFNVGRVISPVINLICERDQEIKTFKSHPYYVLNIKVNVQNGSFRAQWLPDESLVDEQGRCINKTMAEQIAHQLNRAQGVISHAETKPGKESAPLPFDLTSLQQEVNRKYGLTSDEVLEIAQKLYDEKYTSYPRVECRYLPESQFDLVNETLQALLHSDPTIQGMIAGANPSRKSRCFDDKKFDGPSHHAIIPVADKVNLATLSEMEKNVYDLIRRNYIAQFYNDFEFLATTIKVVAVNQHFIAKGKTPVKQGWKVLFLSEKNDDDQDEDTNQVEEIVEQDTLPAVKLAEPCQVYEPILSSKTTRPPGHFTEATLLGAMANIARFVKEEKFKQILKETAGLGTSATRAGIIKNIVDKGYAKRSKRVLLATEKSFTLMAILPAAIKSPGMTAAWEQELSKIGSNKQTKAVFMQSIVGWINHMVSQTKSNIATSDLSKIFSDVKPTALPCPKCGGELGRRKRKSDNKYFWVCANSAVCGTFMDDKAGKPVPRLMPEDMPHCPECGALMRKCKGKAEGKKRATEFWGCTRYKDGCRGFLSLTDAKKQKR